MSKTNGNNNQAIEVHNSPQPLKPESVTEKANVDDLEMDSDSEIDEHEEIPEGSLFEFNVPGVLSKEEVEKLDLAHWKILVRNTLVDLEVRAPSYLWTTSLCSNYLSFRTFEGGRTGKLTTPIQLKALRLNWWQPSAQK